MTSILKHVGKFSLISSFLVTSRSALTLSTIFLTYSTLTPEAEGKSPNRASISIKRDVVLAKTHNHRLLGGNIALWYHPEQLKELGKSPFFSQWKPGIIRIPGGSWSDEYYWNGNGVRLGKRFNSSKRTKHGWKIDYSRYQPGFRIKKGYALSDYHGHSDVKTLHEFSHKYAPDTMVTVNAGMGTPKMAAEWVRWANKKMGYNVKYWEIGNELEGSWELGNTRPDGSKMNAKKYAAIFLKFAKAMKAVDPSIKIGGPTSANDSITYVEELIKSAGDEIDFISFHTYPVDARMHDPVKMLDESARFSKATKKIRSWLHQYQPKRADQIEIGITEWHVQVHEGVNTGNLLSGVWSTRFIGEMFKNKIDFANQWDTFSTSDHGGHGLFPSDSLTHPRAAYWALWLWANHMRDQLVESQIDGSNRLVAFATTDSKTPDKLSLLLINQSPDTWLDVDLSQIHHSSDQARMITLSHQSYLWNPYTQKPEWSLHPTEKNISLSKQKTAHLPPLSATVIKWGEKATPHPYPTRTATPDMLLPRSHPSDIPFSTYLILRNGNSTKPYHGKPVKVKISVEGPAKLSTYEFTTAHPATPIHFTATGAGMVKLTIKAGNVTTVKSFQFKKIQLWKKILWTFGNASEVQLAHGNLPSAWNVKARRGENVMEVSFDHLTPVKGKDLALEINPLSIKIPKEKIGGVIVTLKADKKLLQTAGNSKLQIILQSGGNHWMLIDSIPIKELGESAPEKWKTFKILIEDPKHLKVVSEIYSLIFQVKGKIPLTGKLYIDDLGFILRN